MSYHMLVYCSVNWKQKQQIEGLYVEGLPLDTARTSYFLFGVLIQQTANRKNLKAFSYLSCCVSGKQRHLNFASFSHWFETTRQAKKETKTRTQALLPCKWFSCHRIWYYNWYYNSVWLFDFQWTTVLLCLTTSVVKHWVTGLLKTPVESNLIQQHWNESVVFMSYEMFGFCAKLFKYPPPLFSSPRTDFQWLLKDFSHKFQGINSPTVQCHLEKHLLELPL